MKGDARDDGKPATADPGRGSSWWRVAVFLYLIRFPLIAGATLFLVPILAGEGGALESILSGAFELPSAWTLGTVYVIGFGVTLAWTVLVTVRLVWLYGPFRYAELTARSPQSSAAGGRRKWIWRPLGAVMGAVHKAWAATMATERWTGHIVFAFLAAPLLVRVLRTNVNSLCTLGVPALSSVAALLIYAVLGLVFAVAFFWVAEYLHRCLRPRADTPDQSVRFLLLPPHREGWLSRVEARADSRDPQRTSAIYRWVAARLAQAAAWLGPGYCEPGNGPPRLLAGHALAFALLVVAMVLHALLGVPHLMGWLHELPSSLPYLLSAGILLTWLMAGLSFYLDRLRVPVALLLVVWFYAMTFIPWNEHHFALETRNWATPEAPEAGTVVGDREMIVVVAASGGGIRATAWTARVLAGLEELSRKDPEMRARHVRFAPHVRLLSGVSGGSLGILQFAGAYLPDRPELSFNPPALVDLADRSSLDPLVWGLVYPDFRLAFLPFAGAPSTDRGFELEKEWDRSRKMAELEIPERLADWRKRTADGLLPALIFNSTNAETGERVLTGTTTMKNKEQNGRVLFDYLYRSERDLAPLTAVRMSATFPFVTPAAKSALPSPRPKRGKSSWVDGGYSDNFGMASLLNWLPEALQAPQSKLRRVLVVEIRAAPDALEGSTSINAGRGVFYQLGVPLEAMLSVWNSGQAVRNDTQLAMVQLAWDASKGYEIIDTIFTLRLEANPDGSPATLPLSWHLTRQQRQQLDKAWLKIAQDPYGPWPAIRGFLLDKKTK